MQPRWMKVQSCYHKLCVALYNTTPYILFIVIETSTTSRTTYPTTLSPSTTELIPDTSTPNTTSTSTTQQEVDGITTEENNAIESGKSN